MRLAADPDLVRAASEARSWLYDALDLWSGAGIDRVEGGFHDRLTQEGRPESRPKRCRVQARQVYSFLEGGRLGWTGAWRDIARDGLDHLVSVYQGRSGSFRSTIGVDDRGDAPADNYDQAFALFALAHGAHVLDNAADYIHSAERCLSRMINERAHPDGGFFESRAERTVLLANPHMHLLEAALAWRSAELPRFELLGETIARLAGEKMIEPDTGGLTETFAGDWSRLPEQEGGVIEPGHQFEWAWLLDRWGGLRQASRHLQRLYESGRRGVDQAGMVVAGELDLDGSVRAATTRLWPHTEHLKAALMMARGAETARRAEFERHAYFAWRGVRLFLDAALRGLWFDTLKPDGTFVDEGAPASSLYHLVGGISELIRYIEEPIEQRGAACLKQ